MDRKRSPRKNVRNTIIAAAVSILLLTAVLFLTILEFSPVRQVSPTPSINEQITLVQLMGKFMRNVQQAARQQQTTVSIEFTESEVNLILNALLRIADQQRKPNDPRIYASWQQGRLRTEASIQWCGAYVNLCLTTVPSIINHKLQLPIVSVSVGKMPLPVTYAEKIMQEQLVRYASDQRFKQAMQAIESLKTTSSGNLELILNVPQASRAIMSLL